MITMFPRKPHNIIVIKCSMQIITDREKSKDVGNNFKGCVFVVMVARIIFGVTRVKVKVSGL